MNSLAPRCYDIPSFYKMMSTCFENLTRIMSIFGDKNTNTSFDSMDELSKLIMAIHDDDDKKVS